MQPRNPFADLPLQGHSHQAAASPHQHGLLHHLATEAHTVHSTRGFSASCGHPRAELCCRTAGSGKQQALRSALAGRGSFAMTWPSHNANPASPGHSQMSTYCPPQKPGLLPCYLCSSCIWTKKQFSSLSSSESYTRL